MKHWHFIRYLVYVTYSNSYSKTGYNFYLNTLTRVYTDLILRVLVASAILLDICIITKRISRHRRREESITSNCNYNYIHIQMAADNLRQIKIYLKVIGLVEVLPFFI